MGFEPIKCKQCGSSIEIDETTKYAVCPYCGTQYVNENENNDLNENNINNSNSYKVINLIINNQIFAIPDFYKIKKYKFDGEAKRKELLEILPIFKYEYIASEKKEDRSGYVFMKRLKAINNQEQLDVLEEKYFSTYKNINITYPYTKTGVGSAGGFIILLSICALIAGIIVLCIGIIKEGLILFGSSLAVDGIIVLLAKVNDKNIKEENEKIRIEYDQKVENTKLELEQIKKEVEELLQ